MKTFKAACLAWIAIGGVPETPPEFAIQIAYALEFATSDYPIVKKIYLDLLRLYQMHQLQAVRFELIYAGSIACWNTSHHCPATSSQDLCFILSNPESCLARLPLRSS